MKDEKEPAGEKSDEETFDEPTPKHPHWYSKKVAKRNDLVEIFIIPREWKQRNEKRLGGKIKELDVADCGRYLIVIPRKPRAKRIKSEGLDVGDAVALEDDIEDELDEEEEEEVGEEELSGEETGDEVPDGENETEEEPVV